MAARIRATPGRVFLIGIGGTGMSAIGRVLLQQGYVVSGSDARASEATRQLEAQGAVVYEGHSASNLGAQDAPLDAVIVSSAVAPNNAEVAEAHRRGVPVYKRAEWVTRMTAGLRQRCVAIAGTHGKTTTTAMIALIARQAGLMPTFIVGGTIQQLGTNAEAGAGDLFIIEADEYDRMFLGLSPEIGVVTALEWDHPDCYPTPDDMMEAFEQFVGRMPAHGLLIACADDPGVRNLLARVRAGDQLHGQALTYGLEVGGDWRAANVRPNVHGGYDFAVMRADSDLGTLSLKVPGVHNARNALAALSVAHRLGVSHQQAAATLQGFSGVERRFEVKGEAGGVLVVDDYAHHPTEIRATLAAAKARYPGRPVWTVFQPHTYSRTLALLDGFAGAFSDADHVIILDIFAAREVDQGVVDGAAIAARMVHPDVRCIGPLNEAAEFLLNRLKPGALVITLGAGDGYRVGEMVLEGLRQRPNDAAGRHAPGPASGVGDLAADLRARYGNRLRRNESMARHVVLGTGGTADLWLAVSSLEELVDAVRLARQHGYPVLILGSGTNLLVSDKGIRGLVLHNRCQAVTFSVQDVPRVLAHSGAKLASMARQAANQGLGGLEWAVGVPGTLGGAVVNNAGAHGASMADSLVRAELLTPAGAREWQPAEWFEYVYRSSRLRAQPATAAGGYVVLQAELRLSRRSQAEIEEQMAHNAAQRRSSQPAGLSIGSMFKNPPGDYAGRLIEAAGLKGRQIGGARVSELHANFFINAGGARAADFIALIELARDAVKTRFDVDLELEIQPAGDWSE